MKNKLLFLLTLLLILLFLCSCSDRGEVVLPAGSIAQRMTPGQKSPVLEQTTDQIVISFAGDMNVAAEVRYENLGACFNRFAKTVEPEYFLKNVSHIFQNDDITIADVENVFTDNALPRVDKGDESYAYWYRSGSENAKILSCAGIEIGSIANNHTMDFGTQGYEDTKAALEAQGMTWGDETHPIYVEKHGVRIGIFCCKLFGGGQLAPIMNWLEQEAPQKSDYQIVFFHGGTERIFTPDSWKVNYCHQMIDAGADLVIGGHPHVLQPFEEYNGGYIVYSMGNFLFGGSRTCENETIVYQQILTVQNGEIIDEGYEMIPCRCYTDTLQTPYQPDVVTDPAAKQKILDFMHGRADTPMP